MNSERGFLCKLCEYKKLGSGHVHLCTLVPVKGTNVPVKFKNPVPAYGGAVVGCYITSTWLQPQGRAFPHTTTFMIARDPPEPYQPAMWRLPKDPVRIWHLPNFWQLEPGEAKAACHKLQASTPVRHSSALLRCQGRSKVGHRKSACRKIGRSRTLSRSYLSVLLLPPATCKLQPFPQVQLEHVGGLPSAYELSKPGMRSKIQTSS